MPSRAIVIRFGKLSNKISLRTAAAAGAHASAIRFRVYDADAAYACARSFLYSILPLALTYVRFDLLASRTNVSVGTAMPPHRRCLSPPADVSILSSTCSTRRADNDDERGDSRSRGIFFTMGRREGGENGAEAGRPDRKRDGWIKAARRCFDSRRGNLVRRLGWRQGEGSTRDSIYTLTRRVQNRDAYARNTKPQKSRESCSPPPPPRILPSEEERGRR